MKFYRINVSGTKYFLSENNIWSDGPNAFTDRFSYSNGTRMATDTSPDVFYYIHQYLQGYELPWSTLSPTELRNILSDAQYYKLPKLKRVVRNRLYSVPSARPHSSYSRDETTQEEEEEEDVNDMDASQVTIKARPRFESPTTGHRSEAGNDEPLQLPTPEPETVRDIAVQTEAEPEMETQPGDADAPELTLAEGEKLPLASNTDSHQETSDDAIQASMRLLFKDLNFNDRFVEQYTIDDDDWLDLV